MTHTAEVAKGLQQIAGKYLTFLLASEDYCVDILKVHQIIQLQPITKVPMTPSYIRGVLNLRGKVIPVLDLRIKFNMHSIEDSRTTCIVIVQVEIENIDMVIGLVIDEVRDVIIVSPEDLEETPEFGSAIDTHFIMGLVRSSDNVKILLDVDKILSLKDFSLLSTIDE